MYNTHRIHVPEDKDLIAEENVKEARKPDLTWDFLGYGNRMDEVLARNPYIL